MCKSGVIFSVIESGNAFMIYVTSILDVFCARYSAETPTTHGMHHRKLERKMSERGHSHKGPVEILLEPR